MADAIRLRGVSVARGRRTILHDVDLDARYGSILAVLGPNGAGKSTLLDAIAAFLPVAGEIEVAGRWLASLSMRDRARTLAYVPQESELRAAFPALDVVAQGRFAHRDRLGGPTEADRSAVEEAMAATDTTRFAARPFTALSAGERRRVLLARALATGARILLLDEPSASLDVGQSLALDALLRRLADEGKSIVIVIHGLDQALRLADQAVLLDAGRVVARGPTETVIAPEPVRTVYDVDLVPGGGLGFRRASESA